MTKKDLKKYTVIQDTINGIYTVPQAARILNLSDRQIQSVVGTLNISEAEAKELSGQIMVSYVAVHMNNISNPKTPKFFTEEFLKVWLRMGNEVKGIVQESISDNNANAFCSSSSSKAEEKPDGRSAFD